MHILLRTHRGSAILIAMIVLVLVTITTTVFLESIWNFSQSSAGIESSNKAYYDAIGLIEQQLIDPSVNKYHPWAIAETGSLSTTYGIGGKLTVSTGGTIVPLLGKGNSPFDPDYNYNLITLGDPVQLVIPDGITWSNVKFYFRVPQISPTSGTGTDPLLGGSGVILWTLGSTGASLFASGETNIFTFSQLNNTIKYIGAFHGTTNSGSSETFQNFYDGTNYLYLGSNGANCAGYNCTLKLSMIRPIITDDGRSLPFLEYKIVFDAPNPPLPSQYMTLQSDAYVRGFMRSRTVRIPQITTNTALDFAVLQ